MQPCVTPPPPPPPARWSECRISTGSAGGQCRSGQTIQAIHAAVPREPAQSAAAAGRSALVGGGHGRWNPLDWPYEDAGLVRWAPAVAQVRQPPQNWPHAGRTLPYPSSVPGTHWSRMLLLSLSLLLLLLLLPPPPLLLLLLSSSSLLLLLLLVDERNWNDL